MSSLPQLSGRFGYACDRHRQVEVSEESLILIWNILSNIRPLTKMLDPYQIGYGCPWIDITWGKNTLLVEKSELTDNERQVIVEEVGS